MKNIFLIVLLFAGIICSAQKKDFNQFSVEANYGLSLPITPIPEGRKAGEFNGFTHFSIGARYMFIPEIGARVSYSHDKFQDSKITSNNLTYHGFNIEAVSNLVALFNFQGDFWVDFGLLAHAGGGYITASTVATNNERVGKIIIGVNPMYRLSEKFALSLDFLYNLTPKMNFGYNGQLIEPDFNPSEGFKSFNGGYMNIVVGIKFYLGNRGEHADWQ